MYVCMYVCVLSEYVLWLDSSEELALSRVCVAERSVFNLKPQLFEDYRLENGSTYIHTYIHTYIDT